MHHHATFSSPSSVDDATLRQAVNRRAWYVTNTIVWAFLFIYPFFSILDLMFAPYVWQSLFVVRLTSVLLVYIVYELTRQRGWDYRLPLHALLGTVSLTYALVCNVVDYESIGPYFLTLDSLFLLFNAVVYWEAIYSYLHTGLAVTGLLLGYYLVNQRFPLTTLLEEGGQGFLIVALCAAYLPRARYRLLWKETRLQVLTRHTNQQLQALNDELSAKNAIISATNDQLQRVNEQKNKFIHIAGHDLKNLVGTIKLSVTELQTEDWTLSEDQREYVGFIAESTQRIHYLLNKLLDMPETEQPQIAFNYEVVDVHSEIHKIVRNLAELAAQKRIQLRVKAEPVPMSVRLDRVFAGQIFHNLIANAIKFSQPANTLTLQTGRVEGRFVFELTDPGLAIGQTRLDSLFNKLDELSLSTISSPDRAGLGLAIARRLTEAMDGRLVYRSDPATGNHYRVEFSTVEPVSTDPYLTVLS